MFNKNPQYVAPPLIRLAESQFPRLMRHRTNREDALQALRIAQWQSDDMDVFETAWNELAWLEVDLGLRPPESISGRMVA